MHIPNLRFGLVTQRLEEFKRGQKSSSEVRRVQARPEEFKRGQKSSSEAGTVQASFTRATPHGDQISLSSLLV
jgi:hypothetical protein